MGSVKSKRNEGWDWCMYVIVFTCADTVTSIPSLSNDLFPACRLITLVTFDIWGECKNCN